MSSWFEESSNKVDLGRLAPEIIQDLACARPQSSSSCGSSTQQAHRKRRKEQTVNSKNNFFGLRQTKQNCILYEGAVALPRTLKWLIMRSARTSLRRRKPGCSQINAWGFHIRLPCPLQTVTLKTWVPFLQRCTEIYLTGWHRMAIGPIPRTCCKILTTSRRFKKNCPPGRKENNT